MARNYVLLSIIFENQRIDWGLERQMLCIQIQNYQRVKYCEMMANYCFNQ